MRISDETSLQPESNHLYLTEAPLKGKPRQRRRSWGRGRRLCVARGLCATCEAKIDDCLAAHQHKLLLLHHHTLHQHQLWDPSSTFHQFVPEGVSVGGLALVHKCVMCIGSGELSGREPASHIQIHTCSVTARVCTASCLPSLFLGNMADCGNASDNPWPLSVWGGELFEEMSTSYRRYNLWSGTSVFCCGHDSKAFMLQIHESKQFFDNQVLPLLGLQAAWNFEPAKND